MKQIVSIPIGMFFAAELFRAGKNEVREAIQSVAISQGCIVGTNGQAMLCIERETLPPDVEILIPPAICAQLKANLRTLGDRALGMLHINMDGKEARAFWNGDMNTAYEWTTPDVKYPDVHRLLKAEHVEAMPEFIPPFDWQYLVSAQKAWEYLTNKRGYHTRLLPPKAVDTLQAYKVICTTRTDVAVNIYVMPLRG